MRINMIRKFRTVVIWIMTFVMLCSVAYTNLGTGVTLKAAGATPVEMHGELSVSGTQLVDSYGQPFQIRGVSTHGLQWFSQFNNQAAYQTLRDDWGANCIRLAMYTEGGGYCQGNADHMKNQVKQGVEYATNLGMYAIIDWHILSDYDPNMYKDEAKAFFADMASTYKDYDNVVYEICNEPNQSQDGSDKCTWDEIKSYALEIIPVIRQYDSDAIIIVGTPSWSQLGQWGHTYEPATEGPITGYSNIMYAFHFYASDPSHNQWIKNKIETAINTYNLPVFVTEFGLSEASGDGNVDLDKATEWMNRCDKYNVSYCVWSLSNDWRSSSLIKQSCSKTSGWTTDDLTTAGNFIRSWYRSKMEVEDPTYNNPEVENLAEDITISYRTHVQNIGWQQPACNGSMSGTSGLSKRLEGIEINVSGNQKLGIRYRTHVQNYGWQDWVYDGKMSGTEGESKRLEAICIELTGEDKDKYDVYYRVHAQSYGWLDWAKNGAMAGTEGYSKRLEAINIVVVPKGANPGVPTDRPFVTPYAGDINYVTHVQTYGWQDYVADGATSGTHGESKRLEGIKIRLNSNIDGSVLYQTHVQTYGWETDWNMDGDMSGTSGESKRLEGIRIKLDGAVSQEYDIYYRVHVQTYGWLDWACNGQMAGTSGLSRRLEGIEIRLVPKGQAAPGPTDKPSIEG